VNRLSGFHAKVSRSEKRENVFARKNIGLKTPSGLQFENRCHLLAHKIPLSDEEEQNLWYSHIIFDICRYQLYSIYHYCFTFIRKAIKISVKNPFYGSLQKAIYLVLRQMLFKKTRF